MLRELLRMLSRDIIQIHRRRHWDNRSAEVLRCEQGDWDVIVLLIIFFEHLVVCMKSNIPPILANLL